MRVPLTPASQLALVPPFEALHGTPCPHPLSPMHLFYLAAPDLNSIECIEKYVMFLKITGNYCFCMLHLKTSI